MYINKKSPIPAYYQLRNIILQKIGSGEYAAGNLIPSERELSESLGLSRMTVRQALNQLVSEGVLFREKGKGTFVSRSKIEQHNITSFSETVRRKGMIPSTKILEFRKDSNLFDVKEALELDHAESLYVVKRLRLANDTPIAIEEVYLPEKYFPDLPRHDLTHSLYKLLKEQYSYTIHHVDNSIEASKPSPEEKKLLCIPAATPVLRIRATCYTDTGMKLYYEKDAYRSDEFIYNVRIFLTKEI